MKNKMVLMMVWTLGVTACGPDDPQTASDCTKVVVENTTYCLLDQGIIVETGYQCPEAQGNLHSIGDVNVCSPNDFPPNEEILKKITNERDRTKNNILATDDRCERLANQRTTCGNTPRPVAECEKDLECMDAKFSPAASTAVVECRAGLGCSASDDQCFNVVTLGLTKSAAATAYTNTCLTKRETCTDFSDDFCFAGIFNDATISEFSSCLDLPCDQIRNCLADRGC